MYMPNTVELWAKPDGTTDNTTASTINDAIMKIGSDKKTIWLCSGTWTIDEPVTIPPNIKLKVELGVVLTKAGTGTLAINGEFEAPDDEIFKGFKSSGYDNYFRYIDGIPCHINDWEEKHPYTLNDRVLREGNNVYKCVKAGTSASSGGPTGNDPNADLVDETVHWRFISDRTFWEKDHKYNPGERVLKKYNGCVYECISGGTSGEEGPMGNDPAVTITDGTVHWKFVEYLNPPIPTTADITFGKLPEKVYVTWFGADRTGTNESCHTLQVAIDSVVASGGGTVFFPAGRYKTDERNLYVDDVSRGSIKTRFVGAGMFLSQIFTTLGIHRDVNDFVGWPEPRNHSTALLSMYNVSDIEVCHLGFKGALPAPGPDEDWNKKWEEFAKPPSVYAGPRAANQKGIVTGSTNWGKDTVWYIDRPYPKNIEVHHCYFEAIESEACYAEGADGFCDNWYAHDLMFVNCYSNTVNTNTRERGTSNIRDIIQINCGGAIQTSGDFSSVKNCQFYYPYDAPSTGAAIISVAKEFDIQGNTCVDSRQVSMGQPYIVVGVAGSENSGSQEPAGTPFLFVSSGKIISNTIRNCRGKISTFQTGVIHLCMKGGPILVAHNTIEGNGNDDGDPVAGITIDAAVPGDTEIVIANNTILTGTQGRQTIGIKIAERQPYLKYSGVTQSENKFRIIDNITDAANPTSFAVQPLEYRSPQMGIAPYGRIIAISLGVPNNVMLTPSVSLGTPVALDVTRLGSGNLKSGTYSYRVTALAADGSETLPSEEVSITVTEPINSVRVKWQLIENAKGYKIYGRSSSSEKFLAGVGRRSEWSDYGDDTPSGDLPAYDHTLGNLAAGTYSYRVSALSSNGGETQACDEVSIELSAPGGVDISWQGVKNAIGYRIYGRASGEGRLLVTLGNHITSWHDDGSIDPNSSDIYPLSYNASADIVLYDGNTEKAHIYGDGRGSFDGAVDAQGICSRDGSFKTPTGDGNFLVTNGSLTTVYQEFCVKSGTVGANSANGSWVNNPVITTDATPTDAFVFPIPDNSVIDMDIVISGYRTGGSSKAGAVGDVVRLKRNILVKRIGSNTPIIIKNTTIGDDSNDPGWTVSARAPNSSGNFYFQVEGVADTTISWVVHVRYALTCP